MIVKTDGTFAALISYFNLTHHSPPLSAGHLVLHPRLPDHDVLRGPRHHLQHRQDPAAVGRSGHWGQARGPGLFSSCG